MGRDRDQEIAVGCVGIVGSLIYIPILLYLYVDLASVKTMIKYFDTIDEFDSEVFDKLADWKIGFIWLTTGVAAVQFLSGCARLLIK
jgi:uncharacterized membrane protein YfcA